MKPAPSTRHLLRTQSRTECSRVLLLDPSSIPKKEPINLLLFLLSSWSPSSPYQIPMHLQVMDCVVFLACAHHTNSTVLPLSSEICFCQSTEGPRSIPREGHDCTLPRSSFHGPESSYHDGFLHPPVDAWMAPEFYMITINAAVNILCFLLCSYKFVFSDYSPFCSGVYN